MSQVAWAMKAADKRDAGNHSTCNKAKRQAKTKVRQDKRGKDDAAGFRTIKY
jgi:hypothetical protein